MDINQVAKKTLPPIVSDTIRTIRDTTACRLYLARGGIPYSRGYRVYRKKLIIDSINNEKMLYCFRHRELLPQGYGIGIDERCVEYPWLISQLENRPEALLDAGSALNYDFLLDLPVFQSKLIHILTLAPEEECFWQKSVSYLYHDIRNMPIRDNYYDIIACISTLEHIGCDNRNFTGQHSDYEHQPEDYLGAIQELCRVSKPGGSLFITVPFGIYCHIGNQQQFDREMLSKVVEVMKKLGEVKENFFLYSDSGWNVATMADCEECQYVEWTVNAWSHGKLPTPIPKETDNAVAARAVACIRMIKK